MPEIAARNGSISHPRAPSPGDALADVAWCGTVLRKCLTGAVFLPLS